jgi:hypothetical protein
MFNLRTSSIAAAVLAAGALLAPTSAVAAKRTTHAHKRTNHVVRQHRVAPKPKPTHKATVKKAKAAKTTKHVARKHVAPKPKPTAKKVKKAKGAKSAPVRSHRVKKHARLKKRS